ncbi:tetratricopeptide repeat protein [Metabacillus arenae]|uniref:Tetratricopeptide repeat protein n=1 Tax=Metabacillus arenae TaxID=2771434 RepID=A0A926RXM0_9BACI|nr:hypothetical protein [Metabacillus arenae]MBD1380282.1 hypothetical protein [Metabacillus arenae]
MKKKYIFVLLAVASLFMIAILINNIDKQQANSLNEESGNKDINQLEEYVKNNEDDLASKKELVWQYLLTDQYEKAIKLNQEIIKIKKNDTDALHQLSVSYMSIEEYNKAKTTILKLLKFNEYNPVALTNLAQVYFLLNDEEEFINNIKKAIEAAEIQNVEESEKDFYQMLDDMVNKFISLKDSKNNQKAYDLLSNQDYLESHLKISALKKALLIDSEQNSERFIKLGLLELQVNKLNDAEKSFRNFTSKHPKNDYGYFLLADTLFKLKDYEELKNLNNLSISNEYAASFVKALDTFSENPEKSLSMITELLENSSDKYKQVLLYNAAVISKDLGKEKEFLDYYKKFEKSEYDSDYAIAIMLNRNTNLKSTN